MTNTASIIANVASVGVATLLAVVGNLLVAYVLIKRRKVLLKNRPTYQFI